MNVLGCDSSSMVFLFAIWLLLSKFSSKVATISSIYSLVLIFTMCPPSKDDDAMSLFGLAPNRVSYGLWSMPLWHVVLLES